MPLSGARYGARRASRWIPGLLACGVFVSCGMALAAAGPVAGPVVLHGGAGAEITVPLTAGRTFGDLPARDLYLQPGGPYLRARLGLGTGVRDFEVRDGHAYIAAGRDGLLVAELAPGAPPRLVTRLPLDAPVSRVRLAGETAWLAGDNGLLLVDIGAPQAPRLRGRFATAGAPRDLAVTDDGRAYLLLDGELQVLGDGPAASPELLGRYPLTVTAQALAVDGGWVYVAAGQAGLLVLDARDAAAITQADLRRTSGPALDIALAGGRAYLASGPGGLTVFELGSPPAPRWLGSFRRLGAVERLDVRGHQALVEADGGLYLLDVSRPAFPVARTRLRDAGRPAAFRLDEAGAYAVSGEALLVFGPGLSPALGNEGLDFGQGVNLGGQRRVFLDRDIAYVADWFSGIHLYDLSTPSRPRLLSSLHTEGSPKGIVVRDGLAYVADDDHGLQVIDVRDPRRPERVAGLPTPGLAYTPVLDGDRLYLAAHRGGFVVIDIRRPRAPALIAHVDTPGKAWSMRVRGGIAYVADDDSGLLVYDVRDPRVPRLLGRFDPGGSAEEVLLDGDRAYVAFFDAGLYVLDIRDPRAPRAIAHLATPGNARGLARRGALLYVADWLAGVQVVDVSDPTRPRIVGTYDTEGAAWGLARHGDHLFVMDWWGGISVLDVGRPRQPRIIGRYPRRDRIADVGLAGRYAYLANGRAGLQVFDVRNPLNPTWVTGVEFDAARALAVIGERAYVLDGPRRIAVVDISNPFEARLAAEIRTGRVVTGLRTAGHQLLLLEATGLELYDPAAGRLRRLPVEVRPADAWFDGGRLVIADRGGGLLVTDVAGTRVLHYPAPAIGIVRAGAGRIYVHVAGEGIRILDAGEDRIIEAGRIPLAAAVDDMRLNGETLYVLTEGSRILAIDVSRPGDWRIRTAYRALGDATRLAVRGDFIYLAGDAVLTALQALPPVSITPGSGSVRITLPARLPPGHYDLAATLRQGGQAPSVIVRRNAVEVAPLRFGKPKITPEQLRELMRRYREQTRRGAGPR